MDIGCVPFLYNYKPNTKTDNLYYGTVNSSGICVKISWNEDFIFCTTGRTLTTMFRK